jgi:hypothetical protein
VIQLTREEFANVVEGACPFHGLPLVPESPWCRRCPRSELCVALVNERGVWMAIRGERAAFWPAPQ